MAVNNREAKRKEIKEKLGGIRIAKEYMDSADPKKIRKMLDELDLEFAEAKQLLENESEKEIY